MRRLSRIGVLAVMLAMWPAAMSAQATSDSTAEAPRAAERLSGFWIPRPVKAPSAALTSAFSKASANPEALKPGFTLEHAQRWCVHRGMPSQMFTSGAIDIVVARRIVGIAFDVPAAQRYIYTDGRKRPSDDVLDGTTNGFSIGRWEGSVLLVDTAGFSAVGVRDIPGGGWRGEKSHLTERFEISADGETLTVRQTWTDPTVFAKPQSFSIVYDRAPAGHSSVEQYCDAVNPSRASPIVVGKY